MWSPRDVGGVSKIKREDYSQSSWWWWNNGESKAGKMSIGWRPEGQTAWEKVIAELGRFPDAPGKVAVVRGAQVSLTIDTGHVETVTSLTRSELWVLKTRVRVPVLVWFTCPGLSPPLLVGWSAASPPLTRQTLEKEANPFGNSASASLPP